MKDKVIKKLVAVFMLVVTFFSTFSNIVFAKKIGDEAYLEKKRRLWTSFAILERGKRTMELY